MGTKTTFVPCKSCATMIEVPLPEPEKVVVTAPCECGLNDSSRISRHWATTAAFVGVTLMIGAFGSCVGEKHYEAAKITAETEKIKAQTAFNQKELEGMAAELQKYKSFFEEWKKLPGNPASAERPPIDPRAFPHGFLAPAAKEGQKSEDKK